MTRVFRSLLLLLVVAVVGCAVLTRPQRQVPATDVSDQRFAEPADGYYDHPGALHIHTTGYSHDAHGTFEDVVRTANAQRLDFVILTEHNNLQALRDGKQGMHGAVLVLVGMEISTRSGHYLALNITEEIDRSRLNAQEIIDAVAAQGGLGFIAHPYFKNAPWTDWSVTGFTGIEAYNVAHDTVDENKARLALWTVTSPSGPFFYSILDRPYDPLRKWDEVIAEHGTAVGIGATDAHEFKLFGVTFAPYDVMFRMARTHVLTRSKQLTPDDVYDALRAGHAYIGVELLAEAKGFRFVAMEEDRVAGIMGDTIPFRPRLRFVVSLPAPAHLTLYRNGHRWETTIAQQWEVPVRGPGAYRLEAMRHNKPWILSNPIYVHPATEPPPG